MSEELVEVIAEAFYEDSRTDNEASWQGLHAVWKNVYREPARKAAAAVREQFRQNLHKVEPIPGIFFTLMEDAKAGDTLEIDSKTGMLRLKTWEEGEGA